MAQVDQHVAAENAAWTFEGVAEQFDEHIRRSIPLYDKGHDLVCQLSDFFVPEKAVVIELGTATGTLAERFLRHHQSRPDIRYFGVDRVDSMIKRAAARCGSDPRVTFVNENFLTFPLEKSAMIISYYTMQFIHPRSRQEMFNRIFSALEWGGAFLLFEKVRAPDARFQDIMVQLFHEFKLDSGFKEAEIIAKQRSLKGILEPFSTQGNLDLLKRAGFVDVMTIMKYICFEGFLAIK